MTCTRCLFVLPSLRSGGAERVTQTLLRQLDRTRFELHLAVVHNTGAWARHLPPQVTLHDLDAERVARSLWPLVRTVRRLRPHIVFTTVSHLNAAACLTRCLWPRQTRLVVRETATCAQILSSARWAGLRLALYRRAYRQATKIVCQTPHMYCDLQRHFGLPPDLLTVIPNPVDFDTIQQQSAGAASAIHGAGPHVVSLGGLRRVKGADRLLDAFPRLLACKPGAHLWVLGEGPCKAALRQQAQRLKIDHRVHFAGFQHNPYPWLRAADLFALPSRNESSPNALLEAIACHCPPVTLRHPGGTYEILAHLGLRDRFVKQLDAWEDAWFQALPPITLTRARRRYCVRRVVAQYSQLLNTAACGPPGPRHPPNRN